MTVGGYLQKDTDLEYAVVNKCKVTVFVEGEMDYEAFPDIKQYEDEDDNAFQYAIKTEPTTDTPKEV